LLSEKPGVRPAFLFAPPFFPPHDLQGLPYLKTRFIDRNASNVEHLAMLREILYFS